MVAAILNFDQTQESVMLIVIERDNLERMEKADPITLESVERGGVLMPARYPHQLSLLIAYEKDDAELYRLVRESSMVELLRWLERGRKWIEQEDGKKNTFKAREKMPWTTNTDEQKNG